MAQTMSGPKRRLGAATYWLETRREVEEAHLLAKLGRYDSLTGLVREVVDARLAESSVRSTGQRWTRRSPRWGSGEKGRRKHNAGVRAPAWPVAWRCAFRARGQ